MTSLLHILYHHHQQQQQHRQLQKHQQEQHHQQQEEQHQQQQQPRHFTWAHLSECDRKKIMSFVSASKVKAQNKR